MSLSTSVPALPTAPAARLRRPSWRDPRLLIGLFLVLASVAIGARVVAAADHTVPVYAARTTLATGTPLRAGVLEVVRMRVTGSRAQYLDARAAVPPGQVVLRTIGAGEVLPRSAIAPADQMDERPVSIPMDTAPPTGLSTGGLVDVWASEKAADESADSYRQPALIAQRVEVFHVDSPDTSLSGQQAGAVEVLLPPEDLPAVLDALANDARLAVLPVPGSAP
jgi:hypothetical protein